MLAKTLKFNNIHDFFALDPDVMTFVSHWAKKSEQDAFDILGKMLGASWPVSDIRAMANQTNTPKKYSDDDKVFLPMTLAINPEIKDWLIKTVGRGSFIGGGEYAAGRSEKIVEMAEMTPQEFMSWMNNASGKQ